MRLTLAEDSEHRVKRHDRRSHVEEHACEVAPVDREGMEEIAIRVVFAQAHGSDRLENIQAKVLHVRCGAVERLGDVLRSDVTFELVGEFGTGVYQASDRLNGAS
ncbi:hypothetical protein D3C85_1039410 [compost metagenome]